MNIQIPFYLNKLTGEVLNSKDKQKYNLEITQDENIFQILKGDLKPVFFVKIDDIGDYEGKIIDLTKLTIEKFSDLAKEGYTLSENVSTNMDVSRRFKICQHCLLPIKAKISTNQIYLNDILDYFELNRTEMKYFSISTCNNCNKNTRVVKYHTDFKNTNDLNIEEVIICHNHIINDTEPLFIEQRISEVLVFKVFKIASLEDVNDINNHKMINSITKFKDYERIEEIKFKKLSQCFKSDVIEQKYNIQQLIK